MHFCNWDIILKSTFWNDLFIPWFWIQGNRLWRFRDKLSGKRHILATRAEQTATPSSFAVPHLWAFPHCLSPKRKDGWSTGGGERNSPELSPSPQNSMWLGQCVKSDLCSLSQNRLSWTLVMGIEKFLDLGKYVWNVLEGCPLPYASVSTTCEKRCPKSLWCPRQNLNVTSIYSGGNRTVGKIVDN